MISKIYTVYDSKIEAYMTPFYNQANGAAIRAFSDTVNNPDHPFNKHPEDYTLFELGTFDDITCELEQLKTPVSLGLALEFIKIEMADLRNAQPVQPVQ